MVMWNKFASHNKQSCSTWQNCLSCGVILACVSMTNCSLYQILIHVTNLQCMLSCRDLRCFDAKSILSRFTHFSVEQKLTHKSCPWSTHDKYDVCTKCSLAHFCAKLFVSQSCARLGAEFQWLKIWHSKLFYFIFPSKAVHFL